MPCLDCEKIIAAPTAIENAEPHAALSLGHSTITTYGEASNYQCRVCGSKFKRAESRSTGGVEWTLRP